MSEAVEHTSHTLKHCVRIAMTQYLAQLDGELPRNVYQVVLSQIEPALLKLILDYTEDNQSLAAEVLGISRGTLRKKLKQYRLIEHATTL